MRKGLSLSFINLLDLDYRSVACVILFSLKTKCLFSGIKAECKGLSGIERNVGTVPRGVKRKDLHLHG